MAKGNIGKKHLDNDGMYAAHSFVVLVLSLVKPGGNSSSSEGTIEVGTSGGGGVGLSVAVCFASCAFAFRYVLYGGVSLNFGRPDGFRGLGSDASVQHFPKLAIALEGPRLAVLACAVRTLGETESGRVGAGAGWDVMCEVEELAEGVDAGLVVNGNVGRSGHADNEDGTKRLGTGAAIALASQGGRGVHTIMILLDLAELS